MGVREIYLIYIRRVFVPSFVRVDVRIIDKVTRIL